MGRLRKKPWAAKYLKKSKLVFTKPEKFINKWTKKVFKNDNELWIELGMGKGKFITEHSNNQPNINFLGVEKFPSVQVMAIKKVEDNPNKNLRFISGDASDILNWFPSESISKIFINFPDPWPKAKHAKRRLVFDGFLNKYYSILKVGGELEFKSDQKSLFEFALEEIETKTNFEMIEKSFDLHKDKKNVVTTEYENKFIEKGNKIFYLKIKK